MALIVKDRVKETTTTTSTGSYVLAGAVAGYQSFGVIGDGNTTYYAVSNNFDWEVGIGTYTASTTTLSRDTILESSNSGNAVNWGAGTKDIFVTYPAERAVYLNGAGSAVDVLDVGTLGVSTANITTANITAGVVTTTPSSDTDLVNKLYVDSLVSSGIHFHTPVRVESPINLNATYNNGTSGVGATLTNAGTQVALVIDGVTLSVADRVLIYLQTNQTQNGIYTVTNVGSGSTNWVLTRATDADSYGLASPDTLGEGSTVFVQQGATGAGDTYTCNTAGTITFGTTNITFAQVSSAQIYTAGTGLTLTGTQFSLSNVGTAGTYGSASQVPVFTTNAQGQITTVTNTSIAIAGSAITSGVVAVANGGTGISSFGTGVATALGQNVSGSGSIALTTSPSFTTPVLGTPTSGTLSNCTVDGTDAVGFRNTPVNSQSADYTLVLADSGKTILHPVADDNARTFTIPANSSVAYPVGTVITFVNLINTVTIAITSDTMYLAGDGTTGSRTLAAYGVASAVKVASTTWVISGNGLT